ncbi:GNAT family N-acetyltransferase [Candidatus Woesearchaeota archaeon]|nr:GNAT family N-acetyltransferase [Candidatus Woesearchaeota archaeon]
MYKVDEEISIRKLKKGDEKRLLNFYLAFSGKDRFFYQPWPFTLEAMASHIKETFQNKTISLVAVNKHQNIVGHTFVQNINQSRAPKLPPISGLLRFRNIPKNVYNFVSWTILFSLNHPQKPWFGIGVHSSAQGRGLGKTLMRLVFEEAKRLNVPLITLAVHNTNTKAISLYQKLGFNIINKNKKARNLWEKIKLIIINKIFRRDKKDLIEMEILLKNVS